LPCIIFASHQGTTSHTYYNGKSAFANCYYFKIWKNNVLVFNGIPCKNSSNVVGMYDTVSNTFLGNYEENGNVFTAGPATPTPTTPVDVKGCGNSGLPSGYKKLQYIQSTGTQYIDTGIIPKNDTKVDYTLTPNKLSSLTFYFGTYGNTDTTGRCFFFINGVEQIQLEFGFGTGTGISGTNYYDFDVPSNWVNTKHLVSIANKKMYIDNELKATLSGNLSGNTLSFYIGKANDILSRTGTSQKIHDVKLWSSDSLVRNFIPAQRTSDSEIGMYDTVTNTFFTNQGTGTFIAGPEDTSCVVPVKVSGKNLFNENSCETGLINASGQVDSSHSGWRASDYIPVTPGNYAFTTSAYGSAGTVRTAFYNSNKTFISSS